MVIQTKVSLVAGSLVNGIVPIFSTIRRAQLLVLRHVYALSATLQSNARPLLYRASRIVALINNVDSTFPYVERGLISQRVDRLSQS